jgi:hypothetical protein
LGTPIAARSLDGEQNITAGVRDGAEPFISWLGLKKEEEAGVLIIPFKDTLPMT